MFILACYDFMMSIRQEQIFQNASLRNYNNHLFHSISVSGCWCINIEHYINIYRGGSRAAATSKMEHFVIIVNGFQPLTIITKRSILDVAAALDPPLIYTLKFRVKEKSQ